MNAKIGEYEMRKLEEKKTVRAEIITFNILCRVPSGQVAYLNEMPAINAHV